MRLSIVFQAMDRSQYRSLVANSCLSNMHDPCDWRVENVGTRIDDPFLSGGDEGIFRVVFYGISVSGGVVRGADGIWKRRWAGV